MATGDTITNRHTGESIRFLGTERDERGEYLLIETRLPAGGQGPPAHLHPLLDEESDVVAGRVGLRLGTEAHVIEAGGRVFIPAGRLHTWWNAGDDLLVLRGAVRPPRNFEAFMRGAFDAMNKSPSGRPSPVAMVMLLHRYQDTTQVRLPLGLERFLFPLLVAWGRAVGRDKS